MRQHMRRKHINGPATCTICLKQFKGRHVLHSHMKLHFVEQREKHKCNFCGRGFPSSTKRRVHLLLIYYLCIILIAFLYFSLGTQHEKRNTRRFTVVRICMNAKIVEKRFGSRHQCHFIEKNVTLKFLLTIRLFSFYQKYHKLVLTTIFLTVNFLF